MDPKFKIFHSDEHLDESIDKLRNQGVPDEHIYILAHDSDHDRRVRKETDANKIGAKVTGAGTAFKNIFRGKDKTLRSKMEEIGFDKSETEKLKVELDKGKTLLVVTNKEKVEF